MFQVNINKFLEMPNEMNSEPYVKKFQDFNKSLKKDMLNYILLEKKMSTTQSLKNSEIRNNNETKLIKKRDDYLQWSDYFMSIAFLSAMRSKDPNSQVGACIVNSENKIVGIGYNGMPNGCSDDDLPWAREGAFLQTKYAYVCHAEMNAIMNKNCADVKDCIIYVALFPCNECAKLIIQSGIKEVVYLSDKYHNEPHAVAARKLFDMAGVIYRQHIPAVSRIEINFEQARKSPPEQLNK